jgi:hypothetical protein
MLDETGCYDARRANSIAYYQVCDITSQLACIKIAQPARNAGGAISD